ncbi:hypothetical protein EC392_07405 [Lonsdalea populi]|uniref:Lipoprotein n=1 Tax=Lonsdalea populi TaxID=1172565 RepID=A0A3N0UL03_9GAMM|nr:hypothetical protein EC393_07190 [Lonsdalea populi]ROH81240.1 hypothetical protein EC392_07405 [Lonsdalea populi]ROH81733.1 hypothetical protein EC394_07530 [Lonsdalea populi]
MIRQNGSQMRLKMKRVLKLASLLALLTTLSGCLFPPPWGGGHGGGGHGGGHGGGPHFQDPRG